MYIQSKRKPKWFLLSAMAPLASVIAGSVLVYLIHGDRHGIPVVSTSKTKDLITLISKKHNAFALISSDKNVTES